MLSLDLNEDESNSKQSLMRMPWMEAMEDSRYGSNVKGEGNGSMMVKWWCS